MAGHGCPPRRHGWIRCAASAGGRASLYALILFFVCLARAGADDLELHLRASWGGGNPVSWSGSITLSAGSLTAVNVLGLEADAPGVIVPLDETSLRIVPRSPRTYDGIDLHVQAPRDAVLRFQFTPAAGETASIEFEVPLADVLAGRFARELDATGNRFAILRTPGDQLRFVSDHTALVFSGGEQLQGKIIPHCVSGAASVSARCSLRLVSAANQTTVWQQDQEVILDAQGSAAPVDVDVSLPKEEGVYELIAELQSKRFGAPLVRGKPFAERQVQLVVVAADRPQVERAEWAAVGEFDPAHPKLWDRLLRLPSMKMLPGASKGPLGNEPTGTREHLGATWSTLKAQAWQAYPLPVSELGQPHVLEVEFPSDVTQSLAISIVEPNAAGLVTPVGLDSGVDVVTVPGRAAESATHRLVFWPRTKSPLVLLVNLGHDGPAIFGKIRVTTGPATLAAAATLPEADDASQERLVAAYFDKPLFPENFSVADALDAKSGRPIDDWSGFLQGSSRLAEYLRYSGHNGAIVSVLCEGSSLYPSECIAPTPKYDMGVFSGGGSDPLRKDVLELLLRTFDRERLQLVPAVQFCSPLPELEQLLAASEPGEAAGVELMGPDGRHWMATNTTRRGLGPYYNLLDPRVQHAMRRVVLEIAERYASHPSLAGIAIQLSGESYAQLPDDACALDDTTLARFADEQQLELPPTDPRRPAARWEWIQRHAKAQWLTWRAEKVTAFYAEMQSDLTAVAPHLRLILAPVEPLQSRRLTQRVRPQLPPQDRTAEALLQVGLAAEKLREIPALVLARVRSSEPGLLLGTDPVRAALNSSVHLDDAHASCDAPLAIQFAEATPLRLEAFDNVSPFGVQNTHMFLLSHLATVGPEARRRFIHSLALADVQAIADGGQMLTLGQEDATRELLYTYRQIPLGTFETVTAADNAVTQPVVLRRSSDAKATWFYLVNDSPWPVTCEVDFASSTSLAGQLLAAERKPFVLPTSGGMARWKVRLEPYALVAARVARPNVAVKQWQTQVERSVDAGLSEQIRDVRLRANMLRSPVPLSTLANHDFEVSPPADAAVPHWSAAEAPGITVELDQQVSNRGSRSLHVVSRPPRAGEPAPVVWVRSDPIGTPTTGRIAICVWLKLADAKRQPTLRMAIEGRVDGQPYYRRANVGASEDGRQTQPLTQQWSSFLFPIDDLPANGLVDLQVGFDLMGEGEVWIDDVQVYDLWFSDLERDSILKSVSVAEYQIQEQKVRDSLDFLESYWPQFLKRQVSLDSPRVAALPDRVPPAESPPMPLPAAAPATKPSSKQGMFDGIRRWTPRWPFQK